MLPIIGGAAPVPQRDVCPLVITDFGVADSPDGMGRIAKFGDNATQMLMHDDTGERPMTFEEKLGFLADTAASLVMSKATMDVSKQVMQKLSNGLIST